MFKKLVLILVPVLLSSCAWLFGHDGEQNLCPVIKIKQDSLQALHGTIQISIKGYEGYCYYNASSKSVQAKITPVFELSRTGFGPETDVHFAYYTETLIGPPEYLGQKTRYERLEMPSGSFNKMIKGKSFEMKVPQGMENTYSINMGLLFNKKSKI